MRTESMAVCEISNYVCGCKRIFFDLTSIIFTKKLEKKRTNSNMSLL